MKIAFVGDIHGKNSTPLGRLHDYNEDLFNKLSWIKSYCIDNAIQTIVHLGDIYDKPEATDEWKNKFIQIWNDFQGSFYSIIGKSHDLFYGNKQSFSKTCLYNLSLSGALTVLQNNVQIDDTLVIPLSMDLKEAKKQLEDIDTQITSDKTVILLAHQFYDWQLDMSAGFIKDDLEHIKHKCILVLGHDHRQHDTVTINNVKVCRPGSLMRTELSETMIQQIPRILVYNSTNESIDYVNVPCRDINDIYDVTAYKSRKSDTRLFKDLSSNIESVSAYLHKTDNIISCSEALKKLNCPKEEFEYLRSVYQSCSQDF